MDAIILAAGSSLRMNSSTPKQFLRIKGKPIFIYSLELFNKCSFIDKIYVTCNKEFMHLYKEFISIYDIKNVECIEGGSTRQESVYKALSYVNTKSKKARMNMAILQKQTDSIRAELNGAITGVAVANDNTFMLNPALNVNRAPSAKRQVDVQANTAILTELVKQTELAKVTLRKETPLIQVIDRPILPLPKEQFGKVKGFVIGVILGVVIGVLLVVIINFIIL